jgi:exodeoxyribonuclease III
VRAAHEPAGTDTRIDREERKGKGASDHAPVIVELDA